MDFRRCLEIQRPYLGPVKGYYTDWTPLTDRPGLFPEDIDTQRSLAVPEYSGAVIERTAPAGIRRRANQPGSRSQAHASHPGDGVMDRPYCSC